MGTLLFLIAVISSIHRLRRTLSLRYNSMCVCVILSAYITLLFPAYILEIRRSLFQNPADPRIQWNISYLQGFPTRICNDSDPISSWSNNSDQSPIGCNNLLLSGNYYGTIFLAQLSPMVFRMRARPALLLCLLLSSVYLAACLSLGIRPHIFAFPLLGQLATGALAAFFCLVGDARAREEFAADKGLRYAAEQNGNLLYTLIPAGVVARCQGKGAGEMVGSEIPRVTIMFCAFEQHAEMQAAFSEREFDQLNAAFSDFDAAVAAHGMFKYQHVGACRPHHPSPEGGLNRVIARSQVH